MNRITQTVALFALLVMFATPAVAGFWAAEQMAAFATEGMRTAMLALSAGAAIWGSILSWKSIKGAAL